MIPVIDTAPALSHEERNRLILRRTLSAVSHLYAAWSLLVGFAIAAAPHPAGEGLYASGVYGSLMMLHGALLGLAGWTLWKPRRGAWGAVALAALGSLFFATLDGLRHHWQNVLLDAAYPVLAAGAFARTRPSAGR